MAVNTSVSDDDLTSIPVDTNVYRQLIQQFLENSIQRYGRDSEQARMFKLHLNAHTAQD